MKNIAVTLALIAGIFLAGCTTPETRIRQNPAAFDRATPAQQEMIKQGKVDIGFDTELVGIIAVTGADQAMLTLPTTPAAASASISGWSSKMAK